MDAEGGDFQVREDGFGQRGDGDVEVYRGGGAVHDEQIGVEIGEDFFQAIRVDALRRAVVDFDFAAGLAEDGSDGAEGDGGPDGGPDAFLLHAASFPGEGIITG